MSIVGSKPRVLWRMYFSQTAVVASEEANACLPGNVVLTSQPNSELGFDSVVAEVCEHTIGVATVLASWQTDRQTDRHADQQTDRQGQTDRQTDRQTDNIPTTTLF